MELANKATRIRLFDLESIQMRTFHLTWLAFHLCFFGWFGIAPLMAVVREDLGLTQAQIGYTIIASVAATVLFRIVVGPLCDRFGPRRTYAWLLMLGALPVMGIGLADSYASFLLARLAIGAIGASFVITQYHTSVMFAPNVVGTATATTVGWGNLGGGVTQVVMPLVFTAVVSLGVSEFLGWRLAMLVPGAMLLLVGFAYLRWTWDLPDGNYDRLRPDGDRAGRGAASFFRAARDYRVWALFVTYGACFGTELTLHNIAAIYYFDRFDVGLAVAGLLAGLFGALNLFTRTLGGWASDRCARRFGLAWRARLLFVLLLLAGLTLILFARMDTLAAAVAAMLALALFVQMASGATYGVVPFLNRRALGGVAGLVGAGGNAGAVAAGFLFAGGALSYQQGLFYLGLVVTACAFCALLVRFSPRVMAEEEGLLREALAARAADDDAAGEPAPSSA